MNGLYLPESSWKLIYSIHFHRDTQNKMEFSNPLPPTNYTQQVSQDDSQPLTNDDFRKLMMTPRVGSATPATKVYQKQK